jgi:hypothetical protein
MAMADSTRPSEQDKDSDRKSKRREHQKQYYLKNKERILIKSKAWATANRDRLKDLGRANRAANQERDAERQRRWRDANPEKVAAAQKRYREKHRQSLSQKREMRREKARQASRDHYERNKSSYRTKRQEYRKQNKEKLSAAGKAYYASNREKVLTSHRRYRQENVDKTRERNREYQRQKWQSDFEYWLKKTVGRRMRDALFCQSAKKQGCTIALIGCSAAVLALRLESMFLLGMSWENYGYHGWHIDHIIPLAKFDLSDSAQQAAAFHYTNLQPLWAKDNLRKGDRVSGQNLFGFAYAARIADAASAKPKRRRKHGGQHGDH